MYKLPCLIASLFLISGISWAGTATVHEKMPQRAVESLSKATDLDSFVYQNKQDDFRKGLLAIMEGSYSKAERIFRFELNDRSACKFASTEIMPRYCKETAIRSYYLGFALIGQSRFKEAVPYLKEASLLDPDTPEFTGALGLAYRNDGDFQNANLIIEKLQNDLKLSHKEIRKNRIRQAILDSQLDLSN